MSINTIISTNECKYIICFARVTFKLCIVHRYCTIVRELHVLLDLCTAFFLPGIIIYIYAIDNNTIVILHLLYNIYN